MITKKLYSNDYKVLQSEPSVSLGYVLIPLFYENQIISFNLRAENCIPFHDLTLIVFNARLYLNSNISERFDSFERNQLVVHPIEDMQY